MAKTKILAMSVLWRLIEDRWSRSCHTLVSATTIVWSIIQIKHGIFGQDTDFDYAWTMTLTIWALVKVMTNLEVLDSYVDYYQDTTRGYEVILLNMWSYRCTDGQVDSYIPPPNLFRGNKIWFGMLSTVAIAKL